MSSQCLEDKARPPSPLARPSPADVRACGVSHMGPEGCSLTTGPWHMQFPLPGKIFLLFSAQLVVLPQLSDQASDITSSGKCFQTPSQVTTSPTHPSHTLLAPYLSSGTVLGNYIIICLMSVSPYTVNVQGQGSALPPAPRTSVCGGGREDTFIPSTSICFQ